MPYWPLLALILVGAVAATALVCAPGQSFSLWPHFFMGMIFSEFALLKLFHISKFADGFAMYDVLAKKSRFYAKLYPFIELGLGVAYFSFFFPLFTYSVTVLLMGIGTVGVIRALRAGLDLRCACMGTVLDVPLSVVTLSEDIGMGLMALFMLFVG